MSWPVYNESARAVTLAILPATPLQVNLINSIDEKAKMSIPLSTIAPSAELMNEKGVRMGPRRKYVSANEFRVVFGEADDEDEEDDDEEDDDEDLDDEDLDDEDLDDEDPDDDWDEVDDEDVDDEEDIEDDEEDE